METLAYLHFASIYEAPEDGEIAVCQVGLPNNLNPKGVSRASFRLLLLTLTLSVFSLAGNAFALQQGDSGPEVTALQNRLSDIGYFTGPVTGLYGPLTEEAVRRFQSANRLTVDGIAGPATLNALGTVSQGGPALPTTSTSSSGSTMRQGDRGPEVAKLQQRLTDIGYFSGPVSGIFGPITESAVKRFQTASNLTADGIVGPRTASALQNFRRASTPTAQPANIGGPAIATAPSATAPAGESTLRPGDQGTEVAALQNRLKDLGFFAGPVNGQYGPITADAVRRFQAANGLTADGIAGPRTKRALQNGMPASQPKPDATSNNNANSPSQFTVLELQKRLKARGFDPGLLDGKLGPKTISAIQAAQRYYGVASSDIQQGNF